MHLSLPPRVGHRLGVRTHGGTEPPKGTARPGWGERFSHHVGNSFGGCLDGHQDRELGDTCDHTVPVKAVNEESPEFLLWLSR